MARFKLKKFLLDLLFPVFCVSCRKPEIFLCPACLKKISLTATTPVCYLKEFESLAGVLVAADYNLLILQNAIKVYKYQFIPDLGEILAELLIQRFKKNSSLIFDLVLPVPLSKKRLSWRGFNQSEILADNLARHFHWQINHQLLCRVKHTRPQVGLSAKFRRQNIQGAFLIKNQELIKDKRILLVDDVLTTGSTLGECARVLRAAGAKEVWGIVLAKG